MAKVVFSLTDAQRDFLLAVKAGSDDLHRFDSRIPASLQSRGIVQRANDRRDYTLTPLGKIVVVLCKRLATSEGMGRG
jgi:hypothetical protein